MRHCIWIAVAFALSIPSLTCEASSPAAVDRGRLSLAWDAHESGLFEEALGYLSEIEEGSPVTAAAAWLRAECLYDLGRYAAAAGVLQSKPAGDLQDREAFLLDVFWNWVWEATSREAYDEALAVAQRGCAALPREEALTALQEATRFRLDLTRALAGGRIDATLGSGESIAVREAGRQPDGEGWIRAHPWGLDLQWVPDSTLEDWMPRLAARLDRTGQALWVRVSRDPLVRHVETEAERFQLAFGREKEGFILARSGEEVLLRTDEWLFRSAVEGLGSRGAAGFALAAARADLGSRAALVRWAREHSGRLSVTRAGTFLRVHNPSTGRFADLDLAIWAETYVHDAATWTELWADIKAELARPARPYRCFCGRDTVLREVLVADPGPFAVFEKGAGFALAVLALCPLHQQYVTPDLIGEWGVEPREVLERARTDAVANPWDIAFARGDAGGFGYVVLEGAGVSALARSPELLLGALEAVDGVGARGRSVRVVAPSTSSLVVCSGPACAPEAAAARALLAAGRRGQRVSRLSYRATMRLPGAGVGVFRLTSVE